MGLGTLTSKGQITIPKAVRERLGLEAGDKVDFRVRDDRTATLVPLSRKVADLFGVLAAGKRKAVSVEEMDKALKRRLREQGG